MFDCENSLELATKEVSMKTDPLLKSWCDAAVLAILRSVADALGARRASITR